MINETFYFCDLKTKDVKCPKMHECKRYELVKDVPYNDYGNMGFAKLYNICKEENGFKMFMKMPDLTPTTTGDESDGQDKRDSGNANS